MSAIRASGLTLPVRTLLLGSVAVLVYALPSLSDVLIFDHLAIARGEWWRLVTGNLVHHSPAHVTYNLFAMGVVGSLLEQRPAAPLALLIFLAAGTIGSVLWFAQPEMQYFGGLSGIVTAVAVYLCLEGLGDDGAWRWLSATLLAVLVLKTGYEFFSGESLAGLGGATQSFVPVPLAHAVGALTALFVFGMHVAAQRFVTTRR